MTQTFTAHQFEQVARLDDLPENVPVAVSRSNGEQVCLVRTQDGKVAAVGNVCTHQEFEMALGDTPGNGTIECAWHGARFDLKTGRALKLPAIKGLQTFEVKVEGDDILVASDV